MSTSTIDGSSPVKAGNLYKPVSPARRLKNQSATIVFTLCFLIAMIPLVMVLFTVISKGFEAIIKPEWWSGDQFLIGPTSFSGGVGHAILGTILTALIAAVIAVPIGIMAAIMLVEYPNSKLVKPTSFMVDILAGVPSIVAALFVFTVWVTTFGLPQSGFAVSLALVLLMLPVVVRSTEEMLKLVPDELREASYALGISKSKTIVKIVVPTAMSGIISGVFLATARIMGETAPVLILVGYTASVNYDPFQNNMTSLPLFIYNQLANPNPAGEYRVWGAALTLVIVIALANALAALASKLLAPKTK